MYKRQQFHQLRIAGAGTVNELHTGQIFRAAGIRGAAAKQQRLIAHGLPVDLIPVSYTHLAFRGSSLMDSGAQEAITIWLPEMQFSLTGIWMGQQTM